MDLYNLSCSSGHHVRRLSVYPSLLLPQFLVILIRIVAVLYFIIFVIVLMCTIEYCIYPWHHFLLYFYFIISFCIIFCIMFNNISRVPDQNGVS